MYPLNLVFPTTQFIATLRYRTGTGLVGPINGVNLTFSVPGGDKFVHNLPFLSIEVYYNGVRGTLLDDYTIVESGGFMTGFDTVIFAVAPKPGDHLLADYVATN
jgi:hypothetical protein